MPKMSKNLVMLALAMSLVIGVALAGGCASNETQIIESLSPQQASALIQDNANNIDFLIIDVRTPGEFAEGYIEGAILIDYYAATFRDELDELDKNKEYLIYCRSGARSGASLPIMEELGFQEVHDIAGGILAWNAQGLPVVTE